MATKPSWRNISGVQAPSLRGAVQAFNSAQQAFGSILDRNRQAAIDEENRKQQEFMNNLRSEQMKLSQDASELARAREDRVAQKFDAEQRQNNDLRTAGALQQEANPSISTLLREYIPQKEQSAIDALVAEKAQKGETVTEADITGLFGPNAGLRARNEVLGRLTPQQQSAVQQVGTQQANREYSAELSKALLENRGNDKVKAIQDVFRKAAQDPRADLTALHKLLPTEGKSGAQASRASKVQEMEYLINSGYDREKAAELVYGKKGSTSGKDKVSSLKEYSNVLSKISPSEWIGGDRSKAIEAGNNFYQKARAAGIPENEILDKLVFATTVASGNTDWFSDDVEFDIDRFDEVLESYLPASIPTTFLPRTPSQAQPYNDNHSTTLDLRSTLSQYK